MLSFVVVFYDVSWLSTYWLALLLLVDGPELWSNLYVLLVEVVEVVGVVEVVVEVVVEAVVEAHSEFLCRDLSFDSPDLWMNVHLMLKLWPNSSTKLVKRAETKQLRTEQAILILWSNLFSSSGEIIPTWGNPLQKLTQTSLGKKRKHLLCS